MPHEKDHEIHAVKPSHTSARQVERTAKSAPVTHDTHERKAGDGERPHGETAERAHLSREAHEQEPPKTGSHLGSVKDGLMSFAERSGLLKGNMDNVAGGVNDLGGSLIHGLKGVGDSVLEDAESAGVKIGTRISCPVGEGIEKVGGLGAGVLDALGFDGAADAVREGTDTVAGSVKDWGALVHDLAAKENRVFKPSGRTEPPRPLMEDGKLRVVTWNLHKGEGPNDKGKPPQVDEMIRSMKNAGGDVYLLQEVPPDQAREIAEKMGMTGCFTLTNPRQGNMILVNPALDIEKNQKLVVNGEIQQGDEKSAARVLLDYEAERDTMTRQKKEPRLAQMLEVETPGGKRVTIWNTHLSAVKDEEMRRSQADAIADYLKRNVPAGQPVIGGGDLNSGSSSPALEELRTRGFDVKGASIDWFAGINLLSLVTVLERANLFGKNGIQLSDHPMVVSELALP